MNDIVKNVWKPLCIVFAVLFALSWVFFGFLYSKGGVNFSMLETPEQVQADNGAPVLDENGDELSSDNVIPMPKSMIFRSAASLDTQNAAYDSVTIEATVSPSNVKLKSFTFAVEWVNPSSEWATGKPVSDYFTVTQNGENGLQATLQCLQPFGEQIKIVGTATDIDDTSKSAECTVDFAKRIETVRVPLNPIGSSLPEGPYLCPVFGDYPQFDMPGLGSYEVDVSNIEFFLSLGTVEDDFTFSMTYSGYPDNASKMSSPLSAYYPVKACDTVPADNFLITSTEEMFGAYGDNNKPYECQPGDKSTALSALTDTSGDVFLYGMSITFTGNYTSFGFPMNIHCSSSYYDDYFGRSLDVDFDKSNVIV